MNTLRIGMFSWESDHSIKVGGISPHVTRLSEELAKKHEVHIFTRRGWRRDYDEINGVHYQRCEHDDSGGIVYQMDRMCESMIDRIKAVEKIFGRFDVLHGHDWHPVTALCELKKLERYPFVFTFHSTEWGRNGNNHSYSDESREISHREWLGGYESKEVIVTSDNLKNEVKNLFQLPDYKMNIVPNGIDAGSMRREVNAGKIKDNWGIHPLAPLVLFVGRMAHQKGPDLLVEAVPHVLNRRWDARFIFAGEGYLRQVCENRASRLGVDHACSFPGYISDTDLRSLLNSCDIFCMPSRNEPFGIAALEAWDAGKPVIG
ncbi:MAG: glycosyltransferase family 4 protein, partial [Halobacteriota archaeon]|nr:glycosyltransferase family 4 protein [Halobacteriota archaeon]